LFVACVALRWLPYVPLHVYTPHILHVYTRTHLHTFGYVWIRSGYVIYVTHTHTFVTHVHLAVTTARFTVWIYGYVCLHTVTVYVYTRTRFWIAVTFDLLTHVTLRFTRLFRFGYVTGCARYAYIWLRYTTFRLRWLITRLRVVHGYLRSLRLVHVLHYAHTRLLRLRCWFTTTVTVHCTFTHGLRFGWILVGLDSVYTHVAFTFTLPFGWLVGSVWFGLRLVVHRLRLHIYGYVVTHTHTLHTLVCCYVHVGLHRCCCALRWLRFTHRLHRTHTHCRYVTRCVYYICYTHAHGYGCCCYGYVPPLRLRYVWLRLRYVTTRFVLPAFVWFTIRTLRWLPVLTLRFTHICVLYRCYAVTHVAVTFYYGYALPFTFTVTLVIYGLRLHTLRLLRCYVTRSAFTVTHVCGYVLRYGCVTRVYTRTLRLHARCGWLVYVTHGRWLFYILHCTFTFGYGWLPVGWITFVTHGLRYTFRLRYTLLRLRLHTLPHHPFCRILHVVALRLRWLLVVGLPFVVVAFIYVLFTVLRCCWFVTVRSTFVLHAFGLRFTYVPFVVRWFTRLYVTFRLRLFVYTPLYRCGYTPGYVRCCVGYGYVLHFTAIYTFYYVVTVGLVTLLHVHRLIVTTHVTLPVTVGLHTFGYVPLVC